MNFQFYISRENKPVIEYYQSYFLEKLGFYLHYCPRLDIQFLDAHIVLLGGPATEKKDLESLIGVKKGSHPKEIIGYTDKWIGRWLLIWNSYVITDCWSSITVYWKSTGLVSQSLLLASVPGLLHKAHELKSNVLFTDGVRQLASMNRLYADDALYIGQSKVLKVKISPRFCASRMSTSLSACVYFSKMVATLRESKRRKRDYWVGLTAGKDSRVALGILKKADLNVESYTFLKPLKAMSLGDFLLPSLVALIMGCRHRFIRASKLSCRITNVRLIEEGLGLTGLSVEVPGSVAYYAGRGCYMHLANDASRVMVVSLYFDLITGTLANYVRTPEYWDAIGLSLPLDEQVRIMKYGHESFGGITNKDFLVKGYYYWHYKQRLVHETCISLELLGIQIFCPGICAELVNKHLTLSRKELIGFKTMRLWLNKHYRWLLLLPYHLIIQEPRLYVNIIKRKAFTLMNVVNDAAKDKGWLKDS